MKNSRNTRPLRKVALLTCLLAALAFVMSDDSNCAGAAGCDDAFYAYLNADNTYFNAFGLYHYNNPTTCAEDCQNVPGAPTSNEYLQCVSNCETNRYTSLGNSLLGLQTLALDTCAPLSPNECAQAQARYWDCIINFDPYSTQDPVQLNLILNRYAACIEASKISNCQ